MVIGHAHKYIFVELPLTASTAIANELKEHYGGKDILHKHAHYGKFLKHASEDEKKYFVFGGVRNPLDKAVSHYFKYLSDHKNRYSDPPQKPQSESTLKHRINRYVHKSKFAFVQGQEPTFSAFFLKYYTIPYSDWSLLHHKKMDAVLYFERVTDDFDRTLRKIGIDPVRKLPQKNTTSLKEKSFWEYYDTPESRQRAAEVFGPYMAYWGYSFPESWSVDDFTQNRKFSYRFYNLLRHVYWRL